MRRGSAVVLVCALYGCDVAPDIVAYVPSGPPEVPATGDPVAVGEDGGTSRDSSLDEMPEEASPPEPVGMPVKADAAVPYDPLRCADDARHLMLIDKGGALSRVDADTRVLEQLGTPECLTRGVVGAALDQQGVLWASTQDGQLWWYRAGAKACEPRDLKTKVGALAFVYDVETNRELLYFMDPGGKLVMLDPVTLEETPLGAFKTPSLVGTGSDGQLLALTEVGDIALTLDLVSLRDAVTQPMWKIPHKADQTLRGAAGWQGEIAILFNAELYTFRRETQTLSLLPTDPAPVGTFLALASSVCGASSK